MQLYFIRHGQSLNNITWGPQNSQEDPDPPLTDLGIEQARLLALFLNENQALKPEGKRWDVHNTHGFGLTHLYCSLMVRAAHTAAPIARVLDIPFVAWFEIHEMGGIYSREAETRGRGLPGKPRSYFQQEIPELSLPDWLDEGGWWNRPFEAHETRQQRVECFLADLLARHGDREGLPEQRVAIVSHGRFFMHLMCAILKLPYRQAAHNFRSWFVLSNCSISRFDFRNDELMICYQNRTDFLNKLDS